jgi:hypothetical protein
MKRTRTTILATALFLMNLNSQAQLKLPVTNNELRNNLSKIVTDLPAGFPSLKGAVINQNPQTVEYASLLKFNGAEENLITEYKGSRSIYSWQAQLLSSEDFEEARKKYTWLCNQLKVMTITIGRDASYGLSGKFDPAMESKSFSSTVYHLTPAAAASPRIRIEAGIQFLFPEWKVQLTVYEKEREDNERGAIIEN